MLCVTVHGRGSCCGLCICVVVVSWFFVTHCLLPVMLAHQLLVRLAHAVVLPVAWCWTEHLCMCIDLETKLKVRLDELIDGLMDG